MVKPPHRSRFHTLPEAASVPFMSDWRDMRPFSDVLSGQP